MKNGHAFRYKPHKPVLQCGKFKIAFHLHAHIFDFLQRPVTAVALGSDDNKWAHGAHETCACAFVQVSHVYV